MKNRLKQLEQKQPAPDYKKALISYGRKWLKDVRRGNDEAALQARKKAEEYFDKLPEYRKNPPFCNKVLYIQWEWFAGWLNEDTRKFYKRCQREGTSPNHIARMENFNPNQSY